MAISTFFKKKLTYFFRLLKTCLLLLLKMVYIWLISAKNWLIFYMGFSQSEIFPLDVVGSYVMFGGFVLFFVLGF